MKLIAKDRGMGKTTEIICRSVETGKPIVVATHAMKQCIQMKMPRVVVFTADEFIKSGKYCYTDVLVDEIELVLQQLLAARVSEATFTGDISITTKTVEMIPKVTVNKQEIRMER